MRGVAKVGRIERQPLVQQPREETAATVPAPRPVPPPDPEPRPVPIPATDLVPEPAAAGEPAVKRRAVATVASVERHKQPMAPASDGTGRKEPYLEVLPKTEGGVAPLPPAPVVEPVGAAAATPAEGQRPRRGVAKMTTISRKKGPP